MPFDSFRIEALFERDAAHRAVKATICLEIETSRGRRFKVGVEGGVVSAFVSLLTLPGSPPYNPTIPETAPVQLSMTGFGPDQQRLHWGDVTMPLEVGDVVSIRVVEAAEADAPAQTPMLPTLPEADAQDDA